MSRSLRILSVAVIALALTAGLAAAADKAKVWAAGDLKWMDNPAMKGAQIAVLWGDPKTGAYGAFKKLPAKAELPMHTHSSEQKVVGVMGTMTLTIEGMGPKDLPAGSFLHLPAGLKHSAACKAGADCVYFEQQPGKSDMTMVK